MQPQNCADLRTKSEAGEEGSELRFSSWRNTRNGGLVFFHSLLTSDSLNRYSEGLLCSQDSAQHMT